MSNENEWIATSTCPETFDFPVWCWRAQWPKAFIPHLAKDMDGFLYGKFDLWQRAVIDPPTPPKALSQRERDIAAFVELSGRRWGTNAMYKEDSWLAALAHERAWFRAELEKLPTHLEKTFPHSVGWTPIIAMRERCREDAP